MSITVKTPALFALCIAFTTPVLAETVGEKTGVNSTLGIAPTTADFVHEAAISHMFEINQDSGHKDAVSLFTRYLNGGENADLRQWAAKTLPNLEGHLKMAEDLDK